MEEKFVTMGAAQAWQQLSFIQGELSRVSGVQHQPVPEGGEGGDEHEEEQRRRAASRENGQPAPGAAMRVPGWLSLQGIEVKATETSSTHFERETEKEADRSAGKEVWSK